MDAVREAANMPDPVEWMEISVSNEDISELQKAAKDQAVADDGRSIDVATDPVLVEAYRQVGWCFVLHSSKRMQRTGSSGDSENEPYTRIPHRIQCFPLVPRFRFLSIICWNFLSPCYR
jgi:hypothetical protein